MNAHTVCFLIFMHIIRYDYYYYYYFFFLYYKTILYWNTVPDNLVTSEASDVR
jgi:hypothetical protein